MLSTKKISANYATFSPKEVKMEVEAKTYTAKVARVLESGSSFAVVSETNEDVFISSNVAMSARLMEGDNITVKVIPNTKNQNTPWFAVHVHKMPSLGTGMSSIPLEELRELLQEGPLTTEQIAHEFGVEPREAYAHLYALHCSGDLARAGVRAKPHGSDEIVLWGTHKDDFVPVLED